MSVYDDLTFAPMLITDIFRLHGGSGREKSEAGAVPYIAASFQKNGVVGYVNEAKCPDGWLSFVKDGDGGAGTCFYQPAPFWPSNHVFGLEPLSDEATEPALIMMAATITHQCFPKYNRGFAANANRLSRQKIMVPVTTNKAGNQVVDWDGMTRLGEELMLDAAERARNARTAYVADAEADPPEVRFEPMFITDVFETYRQAPAWMNTNQVKSGEPTFPHVTNSAAGNSVSGFIARQGIAPNLGNAITVGIDTQVVAYQPTAFYGATKVYELRSPMLNVHNGLILVSLIRRALEKFSWGHKASAERLRKTRIMVPVTEESDGNKVVNWEGMTRYGRVLRARAERDMSVALESGRYIE